MTPRPSPTSSAGRRAGAGAGAGAGRGALAGRAGAFFAPKRGAPPPPSEPEGLQLPEGLGDAGALAMRVGASALMVHHGIDKLGNPAGFAEFVVAKHLAFLPAPLFFTYAAIAVQLVAPVGLALGVKNFNISRLCSLGLFGVMGMAVLFHIDEAGLEGFPFGVVEAHEYGYELAAIYAFVFLYFAVAGPGKYSLGSGDLADEE